MSDNLELEYKYRADDIKLSDFINMMANVAVEERLDTSSWDYYFWSGQDEDEFLRYRESDNPELTIKKKIKNTNNWKRVELDLPIDKDRISVELVKEWCEALGYKENFRIYKSCFIFWTNNVNYVYYIVYNDNMKELGRFVEVEVNKDRIPDLMKSYNDIAKMAEGIRQPIAVTGDWKEAEASDEANKLMKEAEKLLPENIIKKAEEELKSIGLSPQNRMKKSLWELFRKLNKGEQI